ncbi:MAG: hypothetical protein LBQ92_05295, partial [Propionibacteriaceae bacterium]|nr:hypothetical protein [Propionibacteriaceae bacterium]
MRFSAEKLDCPLEQQLARRIEAGALAQACLDGQLRPPSRVSVIELAQVCVRGQQAWQRFLLANQGLVWQAVRGLGSGHGLDRDELFQEGFAVLA